MSNRFGPLLFLTVIAISGLLPFIYLHGPPLPAVHDEFSYLLAADTFAMGRLTNPSPAVAEAFQSFHILVEPSYSSKYLPGIGLQLAVGQLMGHPIMGVWLTVLLCSWAAFWMIEAVASRFWALIGGCVCLFNFGLSTYYAHTYWGGSLFTLAGFLALGAFLRMRATTRVSASLIYGTGAGIMLITRPVEGFLFMLPLTVLLVFSAFRDRGQAVGLVLAKTFAPAAAVGIAFAGFIMLHNHAVTGNALRPAYIEYRSQYPTTNLLQWKTPSPEQVAALERAPDEFKRLSELYRKFRPTETLPKIIRAFELLWARVNFLMPSLWLLPAAVYLAGRLSTGDALRGLTWYYLLVLFLIPLVFTSAHHDHYFAAWGSVFLLVGILGVISLRDLLAKGRHPWIFYAWVLPMVGLMAFRYAGIMGDQWGNEPYPVRGFVELRNKVLTRLESAPGFETDRALVIVEYAEDYNPTAEWVYNGADPSSEEVIWVRHVDEATDQRIMDLYPSRLIWKLSIIVDEEGKVYLRSSHLRRPLVGGAP